ncbi:hypothetical protein KIPB_016439, partial [Kipferlia bialata]
VNIRSRVVLSFVDDSHVEEGRVSPVQEEFEAPRRSMSPAELVPVITASPRPRRVSHSGSALLHSRMSTRHVSLSISLSLSLSLSLSTRHGIVSETDCSMGLYLY